MVAAEHLVGDLLSLRIEAEVPDLLSDSRCCCNKTRLLLHARPDEVLEDELDCGQRAPAVGAAKFLTQAIECLD